MIVRRIWPPPQGWQSAFGRLEDMRREMHRMFEAMEGTSKTYSGVYPPMNVTQDADRYFVRAELPGVDVKQLELTAVRNTLTISGKREILEEKASYHRREREGGSFSRSVTLPTEIAGDRVEAVYVDGILTITLPKAEEAKPKQITVKTS